MSELQSIVSLHPLGDNSMNFVYRDCEDGGPGGCHDVGGIDYCTYLCTGDLCNDKVYTPPTTTTPGPTTTGRWSTYTEPLY